MRALVQPRRALGTFLLLLLTLSLSASALAQSRISVRGTIKDQSGAVLPGVTVTARNLKTNASSTAVSDARGYELSLDAGSYEVQAVLPGFRSRMTTIVIAEGDTQTLDLTLEIAPLTETVTVTRTLQRVSEVPNAVTVVQGEDVRFAARQMSPAEALSGIPGVFAENLNNFATAGNVRIAIRAPQPTDLRGVQIVQDGVPLTMADGTTNPINMDLGSIGRVEVIRGASSVLSGNSAGGVISLRTEFPSSGHLVVTPEIQVGSFGYQRQQVKVDGTTGAVGYMFNVNRLQADGFRPHSHGDIRKFNSVVRMQLSPNTEIRGVVNLYDMPFWENPSTLALADARNNPTTTRQQSIDMDLGERSSQQQGGLTLEHHFAGDQMFRTTVWAMRRNFWKPIPARILDVARVATGFRSEYAGATQVRSLPVEWIAGLDASKQRDDRNEFQNLGLPPAGGRTRQGNLLLDQLEEVRSIAPFAQISLGFGTRWRLTAGVRYDSYNFKATDDFLTDGNQSGGRKLNAASPKLGLTYAASRWLNAYGNFATAYSTPTTVHLSNRPNGEGGFNEDLQPEDLRSFELGARGFFERPRLRYQVASYRSTLENAFVAFRRLDDQTYYLNSGAVTRNGTETLLEWTPVSRVKTQLSYTRQDFRYKRFVTGGVDYAGKREPGASPQQLSFSGSYQTAFGLRSTAQLRWVDAYPANIANSVSNWAYKVVNLRLGFDRPWQRLKIRPFIGIDNLFDERFNASVVSNSVADRAFDPAPGRTVYVGITIGVGVL